MLFVLIRCFSGLKCLINVDYCHCEMLDQILGKQGSKAKDVYASKISLASRVVKIERQVDDIESKLDHLLELYEEDRKASRSITGVNAAPNGDGDDGGVSRLRPVLLDKQCSEPNSPVTRTFPEPVAPSSAPPQPQKRPMNRGYSDLGSRLIRKKVILKATTGRNGNLESMRDSEVVIVVPPDREDTQTRLITDSSEQCATTSAEGETEADAGGFRSGSSGSASWCEGDVPEEVEVAADGYGSGDSLAETEDAALLGANGVQAPRIARSQRRDVAVDLHLLRPDV